MKKLLAVLALGLVLGACSSKQETSEVAVTTTERVTTTTQDIQDLFWDHVHSNVPYVTRSDAVDIAITSCELFDEVGLEDGVAITFQLAIESGVDTDDIAVILGAGIPTFCPEYGPELERLAGENDYS